MFVTNIFPPQLILQSNYTFSQDKTNYSSLELKILSQINYLRTNPSSYFNYYKNYFEYNFITNIMKDIKGKNKKLNPLNTKKEISLAGRDYLNYLIENKIPKSYFDINKGNKAYFNLMQILSKYGQRKGKIFESVIINSTSASEIVNKLIKDEKAVKMLLNPDMKYICITCGYVPQWKNQCIIIDIIEDFIVNNNSDNSNNGIQILNEIYFDEKMATIEEKFKTKTHKYNFGMTRNGNKMIEYNSNTTKESEKFRNLYHLYIKDANPFSFKTRNENFHKSFSFNKYHNIKKSDNNNNEFDQFNNTKAIINKENKYKNKATNLWLNINENNNLMLPLNKTNDKLTKKNKENKKKEYKIITKNLNLKNIKINTNIEINHENKNIKNDKNNEIKFHTNTNSFLAKENMNSSKIKHELSDLKEYNDNTFQAFGPINDISNVNQIKKQNSFFSVDTDISALLNPKKNDSQEPNKINFTPSKQKEKRQEQTEENINGFCLNDKEKFFKNNKREIKNMIKLYNKERMEKKKVNILRNNINNTEINEVKNTATFFHPNKNQKNYRQIYYKRIPTLSNTYKKSINNESIYKGIKTKVDKLPEKINKKSETKLYTSKKKEHKKVLSLITDNNILFNNDKKRIISFKANRRLYKNNNFEVIKYSNNDDKNNKEHSPNKNQTHKEPKFLLINPILTNNRNNINCDDEKRLESNKYKIKGKHIEEINIDLSNYNNNKSNHSILNKNNGNKYKYIYKKCKTKKELMNNYNSYNNRRNNNVNAKIRGNCKITNIGNINNTIQNTIKNKYIIINA